MDIQDRRALKRAAAEACSGTSCDPKKLVLIHTGAMVAVTLILLVVGYIVDEQIGSTGGLSGMGNRAILTTVQLVLQLGQFVATPFWQIGWLYVTLQIARREQVQPGDLLEGFRQFFPVLRLLFLKGFMYLGIAILCTNIASIVFAMTPWADPIMEATMGGTDAMDPAVIEAAAQEAMIPLLVIFVLVFLAVSIPVSYRFRLAEYVLIDSEKPRAFGAMQESKYMMKGNMLSMLALDLSFWWFYVLDALLVLIAYLDMILPLFGIKLPVSGTVMYFGTVIVYSICQLALYWWRKAQVDVTYAKVYDVLLDEE